MHQSPLFTLRQGKVHCCSMRRQNYAQVCKRGWPRLTHWFAVLAASAPTNLTSQQGNSESSDSSNNAANTTTTPLQASAKLEKLLNEAEEAFWVSRKPTQMAGWTMYKAPRMSSSGRVRKLSDLPGQTLIQQLSQGQLVHTPLHRTSFGNNGNRWLQGMLRNAPT